MLSQISSHQAPHNTLEIQVVCDRYLFVAMKLASTLLVKMKLSARIERMKKDHLCKDH